MFFHLSPSKSSRVAPGPLSPIWVPPGLVILLMFHPLGHVLRALPPLQLSNWSKNRSSVDSIKDSLEKFFASPDGKTKERTRKLTRKDLAGPLVEPKFAAISALLRRLSSVCTQYTKFATKSLHRTWSVASTLFCCAGRLGFKLF